MRNFFIKTSDDKKSIKMNEENHTATISLFGIKILVGFSKEESKSFSFGFNKTKLVDKAKKVFNRVVDFIQKNKNTEIDSDSVIGKLKEEIKETKEKEVDDKELEVKADNYLVSVKVFGFGFIVSFNKKYKNFVNFKQENVKQAYSEIKNNKKEATNNQ